MRPNVFTEYLTDLAKNSPGVQWIQSLAEAGETRYPLGLSLTVDGRDVRWQIVGQLADGEKHDTAAAPVDGQPASYTAADASAAPDAWLGSVLGSGESPQIENIDVWSARENPAKDHFGLTVRFHNGQRVFVRKI
ncbi:hypothetical protein [Streptomyces sp. NBC_00198]|uniref:hypothetical protein n=1 Tax=Streptomyces sp. NBC_00198 TaxID=2975677 RepID=UPI00224D8D2B|nr:hypothetical protein [Streptomyces sp. NBC_00198]MCX5285706.1 hypothetical protein [Streptomyces sp. NBC_00198]MCX5286192.1 hypothetical protein [Streptomyces sp. NBC_00198]